MKPVTFFLGHLLCVATFFGCAPEEAAEANQESSMADTTAHEMTFEGDFRGPLGLQLWSVREFMQDDIAGTLAKVHRMGFREVELAGTYGMTAAAFRQVLEGAGLRATSMHTGYERFRDSLAVVLDEAEALGPTYLGVAWIPHEGDEPFTDEMARQAADHFNTWGAAAKERGLQFFYHVHGYEFRPGTDGSTPFDAMIAATDPEAVQYEIDVFWVKHSGTDPAALLRKYPDRWALMHIKDMKEGTPTGDYSGGAPAETDVPVGTGQIDYSSVLEAARDVGVVQYYIEDESTDPLAGIPQSISFLETVTF